jgi:hypothetical protein
VANDLKSQSRKVSLWNDRPVVVLQEMEDHDYYYHGVVIGPVGMSIEDALARLDQVASEVMVTSDDWNYDDFLEAVTAAGFEQILAAEWWE